MSVNIIYTLEILQVETKLGRSTGNDPGVIVHSLQSSGSGILRRCPAKICRLSPDITKGNRLVQSP